MLTLGLLNRWLWQISLASFAAPTNQGQGKSFIRFVVVGVRIGDRVVCHGKTGDRRLYLRRLMSHFLHQGFAGLCQTVIRIIQEVARWASGGEGTHFGLRLDRWRVIAQLSSLSSDYGILRQVLCAVAARLRHRTVLQGELRNNLPISVYTIVSTCIYWSGFLYVKSRLPICFWRFYIRLDRLR